MGPYEREKIQTTSHLKPQDTFIPQNSCILAYTPRRGLYQCCSESCEISNLDFSQFFFVLVRVKDPNDISSENAHCFIHSSKFMYTPSGCGVGVFVSIKVVKRLGKMSNSDL